MNEIRRLEKDLNFVKMRLSNNVNFGVVLMDVTKFKVDLQGAIESKIKTAKTLLERKCESTF